ncbi:MAG: AtpZ/AtpI family protein [Erysipelotrichaceae bacterium]|nr:AtpZ/AtpI family protein [Erysipelotrichaceae bacterium]
MNRTVAKFYLRLVIGLIVSIVGGRWLDMKLSTSPWIMIVLIGYVILGSLILLIRETK